MAELITPQQFHDATGVDDWRVLWSVAFAVFRTGDFATGVKMVDEIGRLAEAAGHHPDLNLRSGVLEVGPVTEEHWSLTDVDKVRTFWCAVLGYEMVGDSDTADPDGLRLVNDRFAPMFWTLADPEGNEVDLPTWVDRD